VVQDERTSRGRDETIGISQARESDQGQGTLQSQSVSDQRALAGLTTSLEVFCKFAFLVLCLGSHLLATVGFQHLYEALVFSHERVIRHNNGLRHLYGLRFLHRVHDSCETREDEWHHHLRRHRRYHHWLLWAQARRQRPLALQEWE
jgi:hypothetical protein